LNRDEKGEDKKGEEKGREEYKINVCFEEDERERERGAS